MIQLNREQQYKGPLFNVTRVTLENAEGKHVSRDVIEHPGAACVVPMIDKDTVLLVEQWRIGAKRALWEIPAGTLDPGEDPLACAARELEEETGYKAGKLEHLFTMYPSPGILDEKMHIFIATELTKGEQKLDDDEEIALAHRPVGIDQPGSGRREKLAEGHRPVFRLRQHPFHRVLGISALGNEDHPALRISLPRVTRRGDADYPTFLNNT